MLLLNITLKMSTRTIFFLFLLMMSLDILAQTIYERPLHDQVWIFNNSTFDFSTTPPTSTAFGPEEEFTWHHRSQGTLASICDEEGNFIASSNGINVMNAEAQMMENGERINTGATVDWYHSLRISFPFPQTMIMLPKPGETGAYLIIHQNPLEEGPPSYNIYGDKLYFSEIKRTSTYPLGIVTQKNILIAEDIFSLDKTTTIRHANGRDWWILLAGNPLTDTRYRRFLLDPHGFTRYSDIDIPETGLPGGSQAHFSPDGTLMARLDIYDLWEDTYITIFDVDRCEGILSNPRQIVYNDSLWVGGLAFSPNSRFLYIGSFSFLYQYDLQADDIAKSQYILDRLTEERFKGYYLGQLAPNDKVYIAPPVNVDSIHVIHHPNRRASACEFEYLGQPLASRNRNAIPNHPFYGLGPLDDSPCDTLGIDNPVPTAKFEYWQPDSISTSVEFFDASHFVTHEYPQAYSWDFGDGSADSGQQHPVHSFAQAGTYRVCLTARNLTGAHTYCEDITVGQPDIGILPDYEIRIGPNPVENQLKLGVYPLPTASLNLAFYSSNGQQVSSYILQAQLSRHSFNTEQWPAGAYWYELRQGKQVVRRGKLVKVQ